MPLAFKDSLSAEEEDILGGALAAYGLAGEPERLRSLDVWEGRFIASFALDGDGYFLKEWPSYVEYEWERAFCLAIQDCARAQGVPVADIFSLPDGGRVYVRGGPQTDAPRYFSLYSYVGTAYDPRLGRAQILACARSLGALHAATTGADIGGKRWRNDPFSLAAERIAEGREDLTNDPPPDADNARSLAILDQMERLLARAEERMNALGWFAQPVLPIHGDYCQFNCRFAGDRVAAIVDFDNARPGARLVDIARAVNTGLGWPGAIDYYEDFHWHQPLALAPADVAQWLDAYAEHAPALTDAERRLLPLACAVDWVDITGGCYPRSAADAVGCDAELDYMVHLAEDADAFSRSL